MYIVPRFVAVVFEDSSLEDELVKKGPTGINGVNLQSFQIVRDATLLRRDLR